MKLRKRLAIVMATAILATSIPIFASSSNGINKIITVPQNEILTLENNIAPELKIELDDDLEEGQIFYLNLSNAEWIKDVDEILNSNIKYNKNFEYKLNRKKNQLEVKAKDNGVPASKIAYRIPMLVKVTGEEVKVEIDSNSTVVTSGEYLFALSNDSLGIVTANEPEVIASTGEISDITIEETHIGAFKSDRNQVIEFQLEERGFEFDLEDATDIKNSSGKVIGKQFKNALVGKKGYQGKEFHVEVIENDILRVEIPKNSLNSRQKGSLVLQGIKVKPMKNAQYGEVTVRVSGDLNETSKVVVAKYSDYGISLKPSKKYSAYAGKEISNVEFKLSETIADSLNGTSETRFTLNEGVEIQDIKIIKVDGLKANASKPKVVIEKKDNKNSNEFILKNVNADENEKTSITFSMDLKIPSIFNEDIVIEAENRFFNEKIDLIKVEPAVKVEIEAATVQPGLADQEGGKIVIKETNKANISKGKLFIAMEDAELNYKTAPKVEVTEGDLKIEKTAHIIKGGIEVNINHESTKASTLVISGGELRVSGITPIGRYKVQVGGPAISDFSSKELWNSKEDEHNDIDPIIEENYIYVGKQEEIYKAVFTINEKTYTVNGVEKEMDTAAYLAKEGRTMLPVRYVSDALGVTSNNIKWDETSKTVTIIADRVIQLKLDSKSMIINGISVPMTAKAEMKDNRLFIPVAEIARALGTDVKWDSETKTATFN